MASSSKVQFNLETLKAEALKSIDERIARKEDRLSSFADDEALARQVDEWRAAQEARISQLFRDLGDGGVDNHTLSKFKIEPIPERDDYDFRRVARDLEELHRVRSQVVAKSNSLVADSEGNVSLTKTQLSEFFGL